LTLRGVASPSLLIHGGVGLDRIGGHARAPAKPRESEVYDSGRVGYLSCAQGSRMPCFGRGGYVVACTTVYEQEFGVPPHQFLR
jgi:hypothetical protein